MKVIYVDILLTINLAVDYLLLFAVSRLGGARFERLRALFGAAIGSVYSLILFLSLPKAVLVGSRILVSFLMVALAFGKRNMGDRLRLTVIFYIGSFLFSGVLTLLNSVLHADSFFLENGIVYYEFSAWEIVISATAAFLVTELFHRLFHRGEEKKKSIVRIVYRGKTVVLKGFTDTGNLLTEPFSGDPVAVCTPRSLGKLIPEEWLSRLDDLCLSTEIGLKQVPCKTVSGTVLIPAFRPEKLEVGEKGKWWAAEKIWIGLSPYAPENTVLLGKNIIFRKSDKIFSEVLS